MLKKETANLTYNTCMEEYLANEDTGIELLYRGQPIHNVPFSNIKDYNKLLVLI